VDLDQQGAIEVARDAFHTALDPSDILLTGQVAVVSGAGGGIGQGVALGLAKFGADVAIVDVDGDRAERTAESVRELGRTALSFPVNVMEADALRGAIEQTAEQLGRLDVLVNNAGGVRAALFLEQSERSWRRHIEINLVSMLVGTATAAPIMKETGGGSIVNVSSIEAFRAAPTFAVYAACKAGMVNFTRTMALELAEHKIRVNCIAPDQTITPGLRGNREGPVDPSSWWERNAEGHDGTLRHIPVGREGVVEDCASTVVFLCSSMGGYFSGETLHVDGGTYASSGWNGTPTEGWTLQG
jgi:NAD(P)-dependent dehydrogenase (short-subunit alcohol dehydrogenase family)